MLVFKNLTVSKPFRSNQRMHNFIINFISSHDIWRKSCQWARQCTPLQGLPAFYYIATNGFA